MSKTARRISTITLVVVSLLVFYVGITQQQAVFDWWRLRNYTPSPEIATLARDTTMTDESRHLFYVYDAQLQDKESFNQNCQFGEQSIVLGCYVSGQGIYIYNVTDERLAGVEQVTAAHEMLHAAYERLSTKERQRVDALTQKAFESLTNERVKASIEAYRSRDPSVVPNELHSILATEIRDIGPELEAYYSQYFDDRLVVVGYSEKYEQVFTERKERAAQLQQQITSLRTSIENLTKQLTDERTALEQDYAALESQRSTAEPASFNVKVRSYNGRVAAYNVSVRESDNLINQHNALVDEYNKVVLEENQLIQAIDSRPQTLPQ